MNIDDMEDILEQELDQSYVQFAIKFPEGFKLADPQDSCITCLQQKVHEVNNQK